MRFWYSMPMNRHWNYQDIIDLEYFFQQDNSVSGTDLHERDRNICLVHCRPDEQNSDRPGTLLRTWLQARRETHSSQDVLPGSIARETHTFLRLILMITGTLTGVSAGLLFFNYSGDTPVNVLHFLVVFVFSQILLALAVFLRAGLVKLGLKSLPPSLAISLVSKLFTRLALLIRHEGTSHLTAEQRLALLATLGKIRIGKSRYGSLFYWPLFLLLQLFGICFNLGLISSTFFKITVSDLAFGWQSTLQITAEKLYTFVRYLALPWSWLFSEDIGYPSLDAIEGSRIILKEGITNLATPDLISWWPFLLLSVLFYGLFIRFFQYGFGLYKEQSVAANFQPDSPASRQTTRRMQTPIVTTQANPELMERRLEENQEQMENPVEKPAPITYPIQLLLPDEIFDLCDPSKLSDLLQRDGFEVTETHRFMIDYESDQLLLERAERDDWKGSAGVIILLEAWMPPLVSLQSFLKSLRTRVGTSLPIILQLVGKPTAGNALTPVHDETSLKVWHQKITAIGDPYIEVHSLIEEDNA